MDLDFNVILNNIACPVFVARPIRNSSNEICDFEVCYVNSQMKKIAGYVFLDARLYSEFKANLQSKIDFYNLAVCAVEGKAADWEQSIYSPSTKKTYRFEYSYLPEKDVIIITFFDVTTERRYAQKLKNAIIKDPLTGLLNRTGFVDCFDVVLENCRYEGKMAAVLVLDIDDLKNINESIGTKEGDSIIIKVANTLKKFERDNIQVFRYGDDEFLVLISDADSTDSITTITDAIFESMQQEDISISGGVSIYPDNSENKEELVRFADMAVHDAKRNGKNCIEFFHSEMQRIFIQQLTLQTKLTTAVLESSFYMNYQPQFDIRTGVLRGFEALIRWKDSELGEIGPSVFVPVAEETGLIIPIGKWVLNTTFRTLKNWQDNYNFKGVLSVNVSPIQLKQDSFIDELKELVEKYKINPELLEVEITEGVMINNMNSTISKLREIKGMGIKVSLDDFGTGYSSLNYLQALPLDTLKIDKSFINDITAMDGVQANITSSIITMVSRMGLETIAEGVEEPEQLTLLKRFNCNIVQGFLRGKPMSQAACDAYLQGDKNALLTNGNAFKL